MASNGKGFPFWDSGKSQEIEATQTEMHVGDGIPRGASSRKLAGREAGLGAGLLRMKCKP